MFVTRNKAENIGHTFQEFTVPKRLILIHYVLAILLIYLPQEGGSFKKIIFPVILIFSLNSFIIHSIAGHFLRRIRGRKASTLKVNLWKAILEVENCCT